MDYLRTSDMCAKIALRPVTVYEYEPIASHMAHFKLNWFCSTLDRVPGPRPDLRPGPGLVLDVFLDLIFDFLLLFPTKEL